LLIFVTNQAVRCLVMLIHSALTNVNKILIQYY